MSTKRGSDASGWLEQLKLSRATGSYLVHAPDRGTFVIEGDHRRRVRSGLLAAALEELFGRARLVSLEELDDWTDGPPVEILEGPDGPAFVVVGGLRLRIRGLPLPHPVGPEDLQHFPEGAELDVAAANIPRARFERAVAGGWIQRARAVLAREGPLQGSVTLARRAAVRVRQAFEQDASSR